MNREILFKAKRIDNGEWVEGYISPCVIVGKWYICRVENNLSTTQIEIDPETICQYTGLIDKNDKRIWENDILHKAYHSEDDCIVVWKDGRFNFKTIHGQYNQDPMTLLSLCFTKKTVERLKVIGNVYDGGNPELLEVE